MTKIFVVLAEPKHWEASKFSWHWFVTEEAAHDWIEKHGDKTRYWFEVEEVESGPDSL